jgi:hypothetical protein
MDEEFHRVARYRYPQDVATFDGPLARAVARLPGLAGDPRLVGVLVNGILWGIAAGGAITAVGLLGFFALYDMAVGRGLGWSTASLMFVEATVFGILVGLWSRRRP